jgi:hypothetical protein
MTSSQSFAESSTAGFLAVRPALLTRMSMSRIFSKAPFTWPSSVTSQPLRMSSTCTFAPAFSRSLTVAAPMPFAPPVTTAVFPVKSNIERQVY